MAAMAIENKRIIAHNSPRTIKTTDIQKIATSTLSKNDIISPPVIALQGFVLAYEGGGQ